MNRPLTCLSLRAPIRCGTCVSVWPGFSGAFPIGLLLIFAGMSLGVGGEVFFKAKLTAKREGDQFLIALAVPTPTDFEVTVLGNDGQVVRHLAAGVLGVPKPPPEPLQAGLSQTLTKGGGDDFGQAAASGAFKVRVRAGTGVKFGRFLGDSPYGKAPFAVAQSE